MTQTTEELLGSKLGAARRDGGPKMMRTLVKLFDKFSRRHRSLQVTINLCMIEANKEQIENLIMENNNLFNPKQL
jgi:hypothetical protein